MNTSHTQSITPSLVHSVSSMIMEYERFTDLYNTLQNIIQELREDIEEIVDLFDDTQETLSEFNDLFGYTDTVVGNTEMSSVPKPVDSSKEM